MNIPDRKDEDLREYTKREMLEQYELDKIKALVMALDDVVENYEFDLYPEELKAIRVKIADAVDDLYSGRKDPGAYRNEED